MKKKKEIIKVTLGLEDERVIDFNIFLKLFLFENNNFFVINKMIYSEIKNYQNQLHIDSNGNLRTLTFEKIKVKPFIKKIYAIKFNLNLL
jgi:hypothetical protein